jgi:thiopeptide-type bacteriocin biosynthesis protein
MFNNEEYNFFNSIIVRTPFYSLDAYSADLLPEIIGEQVFQNALLLASPDLYGSIEKKGFRYDDLLDKERLTLFKYYNRMSFRPTPFGAFASVSLAGWLKQSPGRLGLSGRATLILLPSLEAKISGRAGRAGDKTMLFVNPALYRLGASWRYIHSSTAISGKLEFTLQSIASAPLYDHLFALAGSKPVSRKKLTEEIMEFTSCTALQAASYTTFLITEQVLLADDRPGLIEPPVIKDLIALSAGEPVPEPGFSSLPEAGGKRSKAPYYTGMERELESGGLDLQVQEQLREVLQVLACIVPNGRLKALQDFKEAFKSRFDREKVPLLTALDPDAGISYENLHTNVHQDLLLEGLKFPDNGPSEKILEWTPVNHLFLRIWLQDDRRSLHDPVEIRDEDLRTLPASTSPGLLPPSLAVLFSRSEGNLVIESAGGATATALAGRFSVFNKRISRLAKEISAAEAAANPDVLFAEIHQRSHDHVDNINRRVQLYDHIIPLNVFPYPHEKGHIIPGDILVSVRGEEVILESLSLGKRIIPRLPTAYNYQHNELAVFRFLCDLQYQGLQADLAFDPERLFPGLNFYPRFSYRKSIISLAKWIFSKEQVNSVTTRPFSLGRLHFFRQEHGIPRHISLTQGDQQLVFDLANDWEAVFFLENIRDLNAIVLREYLFPDRQLLSGKNLRYAGQYLALLGKEKPVYPALKQEHLPGRDTERRFTPGSEWLYLSLYCTNGSADRILLNVVSPVLAPGNAKKWDWFFIRYHDPRPHLRIRIKVAPEDTGLLLTAIREQLRQKNCSDLVSDLKTETYCRELERYSSELISSVEDLFCAGTALYMDSLNRQDGKQDPELAPFVMVYAMITRFLVPGQATADYLHWIKDRFLLEFRAGKQLKRELDSKYRKISPRLFSLLDKSALQQSVTEAGAAGFLSKLDQLRRATSKWTCRRQEEFLGDLVHMEVNRMFASGQRQNEAVIYYCLYKYEFSRIAQEKAVSRPIAGD